MQDQNARQLHTQLEQLREQGNFTEALELAAKVLVAYQEENDPAGFAEALCSLLLTLRHLYNKTHFEAYLTLAGSIIEASVKISQKLDDESAQIIPLFNQAKYWEETNELEKAKDTYQAVLDLAKSNAPEGHDAQMLTIDIELHLRICELKLGDKNAIKQIETLIKKMQELPDTDSYRVNVLISGAYITITKTLKKTDSQEAEKYKQLAANIIDNDKRLVIRRKQLPNMNT